MIITVSGALSSLNYGYETGAFQTKSGSINKTFGSGTKISNLERNNNLELVYQLGDREAVVNLEKMFQGSFSVDTVLSDPWIFQAFLGDYFATGDSTTGKSSTTTTGTQALGSTQLVVASSVGFANTDVIRIAGGTINTYEIRKVSGSPPDGTHINIDKPLYFSHPGSVAVDDIGGSGPTFYYHTFRNPNAVKLNSLTVENSVNISSPEQTDLLGCVPTGLSLSASVNEIVTVSYDFLFGKEIPVVGPSFQPQVASSFSPHSFAYGNLYLPGSGGSPISAAVQSVDLTVTPNEELVYGLGNRSASTYVELNYDYSISARVYFQDKNALQALLFDGTNTYNTGGPQTTVAQNGLVLNFNDGTNNIQFSFGGVKIDTENLPQDPTSPIIEDVVMKARNLTIVGRNATSTSP